MGPRTVLVVAAIAAALTGYFWLFEREPDRPAIGPAFPRLTIADIQEIELGPGQPSEVPGVNSAPVHLLKKEDGSWWIERPAVPALIPRVESIGYSLVELQRIADLELSQAPSVFDPRGPEEIVRFRTRTGEEHRVEVGKDHPDPTFDLCYVRLDGRLLFLTRKSFKKNLQSRLDDLRSRALFPVPKDQVVKLEVSGDEAVRKTLHREKNGDFRFDVPAPAPASREKIARILDDLNSWRAESFIRDEPGDLTPFGLDRPRAAIAITSRDGVRTAVEVGAAAPANGQVYVRWADRPLVMTASLSMVEDLERPAEQFYSEYVLQLGAEEITEVSVKFPPAGPKEFTLKRPAAAESPRPGQAGKKSAKVESGPSRWEVEEQGASARPADSDRIAILTSALKYLAVKRYIPRSTSAPLPEGPPPAGGIRVDLRTDTGSRSSLLFEPPGLPVEAPSPGLHDVTAGDEPFIFQVITRVPGDLAQGSGWFRNRRISLLAGEGLREFEVTIREPAGERTWTLGRPSDQWVLQLDFPIPAEKAEKFDDKLARKVAALLSREEFQVEEWAAPETDLAAKEIDDSHFQVRISLTEVSPDHRGFTRLYLGQGNVEGAAAVSYWCRVNDPALEKAPFLLDRSRARVILDLVDHLKEISKE